MPRKRARKQDHWLPPRVYRGRSAFEWHPKTGGAVRLCKLDASESDVWLAYRVALGEINIKSCQWLADLYFASAEFKGLATRTRTDYKAYWKRLGKTFGKVLAVSVKPEHVRKYMDLRGAESIAMANKEKKLLSIIMRYGYERGHIKDNPCDSVKNFKEVPRDKYITDEEYQAFYEHAEPILQVIMDLSYICAARGQDVRKITLSDIQKDGLFIQQGKTGKKQLKLWNPRLREAVARAKTIRETRLKIGSIFLVIAQGGAPYSESGLKSLWRRARAAYTKATKKDIDWTFHDIKAKAISDYEGDKQNFSGHKSRAMMERYNRSVDRVEVLDFPKKESEK
jgi:integrase